MAETLSIADKIKSSGSAYANTDPYIKSILEHSQLATQAEDNYRRGDILSIRTHLNWVSYLYREISPFVKERKEKFVINDKENEFRDSYELNLRKWELAIKNNLENVSKNWTIKVIETRRLTNSQRDELDNINWELGRFHRELFEVACRQGLFVSWKAKDANRSKGFKVLKDATLG